MSIIWLSWLIVLTVTRKPACKTSTNADVMPLSRATVVATLEMPSSYVSTAQSFNAIFVHYILQEQSFWGRHSLNVLGFLEILALLVSQTFPPPLAPPDSLATVATPTPPASSVQLADKADTEVDMKDVENIPPLQTMIINVSEGAGFPRQLTPTTAKPTKLSCAVLFVFIVGLQGRHFILGFDP